MEKPVFNSHEESIGFVFWKTYSLWSRKIKAELKTLGLTHVQFVVLATVFEMTKISKEVTQKEVADFSGIDIMSVSLALKFLVSSKYVIRKENKIDTRAKSVSMTKTGERKLMEAFKVVKQIDDQIFRLNQKEKSQMKHSLEKCQNNAEVSG